MKTHWIKSSPSTLEAADAETNEWLSKKAHGTYIEATTVEPRNGAHHRLFFALLHMVFENQDTWPSQELLLDAIKIGVGYSTAIHVKLPDGRVCETHLPESIAWAKMDQARFDRFYDSVCDLVARDYWPGITKEEIKAEVAEIVGIGAGV